MRSCNLSSYFIFTRTHINHLDLPKNDNRIITLFLLFFALIHFYPHFIVELFRAFPPNQKKNGNPKIPIIYNTELKPPAQLNVVR